MEDYSVFNVSGRGQELLVIALGETFTDGFGDFFINTLTAKGVKTTLDIGSGQLWEVPKVFSLTANYVFTTTSGNLALEEDKGKLVFDRPQTFISNGAGENLRQAAD